MTDQRFGADTDPPTDFEAKLLEESTALDDIWVIVGRRIGAAALFALFETASGEILSVPTRRSFVKRLYIPIRDQEILARLRRGDESARLATDYRMTIRGVQRARDRALRTRGRRR